MKLDPYKHKQRWTNWEKKRDYKGLSKANSELVAQYLADMKLGMNTLRRKPLSDIRLNSIRQRIIWLLGMMQNIFQKESITDIAQREVTEFFNDMMRNGKIRNKHGKIYLSLDSYANTFKAFWHWYMRKQGENGINVKDITSYLDLTPVKDNTFVYFTLEDLKKVCIKAKYEYKVMMHFMFDSGIRSPTELMNIRVSDLSLMPNSSNFEVDIRQEISKTFGRKIKLLICSTILKDYI